MQAQSADGVIHDFPDGTDISVVDRVMKDYAGEQKQSAPTTFTEYGPEATTPATGTQSQAGADINAVGQGVVSGTGAVIAGAGRIAQSGQGPSAHRVLAALDLIDQGKTRDAYQGLSDPERQEIGAYRGGTGDDKAAQRAELQQSIVDYGQPNAAMRAGSAIESAAPGMFPVAPEHEGVQTGVGRMIGGVAPALAATAALGPLGAAATIASQTYDGTYQDAIAKGATHEEADNAAGKSAVAQTLTMALPVSRLMTVPVSLREGLAKTLVNLGQNGVEFGSANAVGTFANNYVASQTYDPSRSLTQGVGQAGLEGAIAGLIIPAVGGIARAGATLGDVLKAPDVDTAIAAAQKVAQSPGGLDTSALFGAAHMDDVAADDSRTTMAGLASKDQAKADAAAFAASPEAGFDAMRGAVAPATPFSHAAIPGQFDWAQLFAPKVTEDVTAPLPVDSGPSPSTGQDLAPAPNAKSLVPTAAEITNAADGGNLAATSKAAKAVANAYYQIADQTGGTLSAKVRNNLLDYGRGLASEEPDVTLARGAANPMEAMVSRLEETRDQPMSLASAQGIDQHLGDLIDGQFQNGRLSSEGKAFLDLQTHLRDLIYDAGPDDVDGGTQGFDALSSARQAWSQAMKLNDLERIQDRANRTDNPATSIRTGINTLLSNQARSRGYTDEEKAALEQAANRGFLGGALHVFGSRLIPIAGAVHGLSTFNPLSIAAAYGISTASRNLATRLQNNRMDNAMDTLARGVPPMPDQASSPP